MAIAAPLLLSAAPFRFVSVESNSVAVCDGSQRVLVYNTSPQSNASVKRAPCTYIHPLYGLDGEVLTDDYPRDHDYHRGLYFAWTHVKSGGKEFDLWTLKGIEQRFEKWLTKAGDATNATLSVENGWYAEGRKIMQERLTVSVYPVVEDARAIDLDCSWIPVAGPITLAGAEGKSYGGLNLRFAPRTNTVITTPLGNRAEDLLMTHLAWADLTAQFSGDSRVSGAAIFVPHTHPDFPPTWMTRHYGILCVGWPGTQPATFAPGKPIRCQYRIWVHRGAATASRLKAAYAAYDSDLSLRTPH